jgi:hypothetical protein
MAFDYDDLWFPLEQYLDGLGDITQIDAGGGANPRASVFQPGRYNATAGAPILDCRYNEYCWGAHLPINCVAWHDSQAGGPTPGNAVLITPYHAITSEHGRDYAGLELVWAGAQTRYGDGPNGFADTFVARAIGNRTSVTPTGIYHPVQDAGGFRVLYLDRPAPLNLIVDVAIPSDIPVQPVIGTNLVTIAPGIPLLTLDQFNLCWIQCLRRYGPATYDILLGSTGSVTRERFLPPRPQQEKLWRQMFTGDSGSPLFMMHRNQRLILFGFVTGDSGNEGKTVYDTYSNIVLACNQLSEEFAPPGRPYYVPNEVFHDPTRGPRPGFFRPPPSGPLG